MPDLLRDDPVIVLGMHHSGTSILAEVLHRHGVFMHANMRHFESRFFTSTVNNRAVMGGGGNWAANPIMPVDAVLAKLDDVRKLIEKKAYRRYADAGYDGRSRWGFKDPRTCVVLPLYLKLYPNARLLHIVRDEEDVASSLARSNKKGVGVKPDPAFWAELWRQHVGRAREYGRRHPHYYEFRYEDFCQRPVEVARPIFAYLELPFSAAAERFVRQNVHADKQTASP